MRAELFFSPSQLFSLLPANEQIGSQHLATFPTSPSGARSSPTLGSIPNAEFKILSAICKDKATDLPLMIKLFDDLPSIFQATSNKL